MSIIYTDKDKCKGCYACIRGCPAKAIKVENGIAQAIEKRCIVCGNCLKACVTGAKQVENDLKLVGQLLKQYPSVIAIISSSFPAALPELRPGQFVSAIRKLGFSEVMEESFGAELVGREYSKLLTSHQAGTVLSANCPAVVYYIEKFHPELIKNLAPIVSTTIAMGRLIKQQYNPQAKVVFIGPCVAKKAERQEEKTAIDAILTFAELKEMFTTNGIKPETLEESDFSGPKPYLGRLFSAPGGLLRVTGLSDDILVNDVISAHGRDYVVRILNEFARGDISARFINLYFCHGCVDGPVIDNDLSGFRRRKLLADYAARMADPAQTEKDIKQYSGVNLSREFADYSVKDSIPSEEDIQNVLMVMNKPNREDQFNCGACGYSTCRELAIAVCQELAEIEMCWPYVLEELKITHDDYLTQTEKLTSIGQMAAALAHDLNNRLGGVLVYTQLLSKKIANDQLSKDVAISQLAKMESEITRSTKVISNLLGFARQSPPSLGEVDVNEVIERAFDLSSHSAELQNINVIKELDPFVPGIFGDFDQLEQTFTNLILNAIEAMPNGGKLTLRTSFDDLWLKVEVQDTGYGISPENQRKLFTPFFTTKVKGKGVGLGLPAVYAIVQRHRGKISVQSKEGEGTTFTILLPLRHEEKS